MTLLVEVVGLLSVATIVYSLRTRLVSLGGGVTVMAVALSGVVFWTGIWSTARGLMADHQHDSHLTRAQARALPGTAVGAREDVLAWADQLLPKHARVYLDCPQPTRCLNGLANWITYRLTPRVFTDLPSQADWILFYNTPQGLAGAPPVTGLRSYGPEFAIGRVAR